MLKMHYFLVISLNFTIIYDLEVSHDYHIWIVACYPTSLPKSTFSDCMLVTNGWWDIYTTEISKCYKSGLDLVLKLKESLV